MTVVPPETLDWSVKDVAQYFGITTRTVWRWMKLPERSIPHYRPAGSRVRFNSTEVKEWGASPD